MTPTPMHYYDVRTRLPYVREQVEYASVPNGLVPVGDMDDSARLVVRRRGFLKSLSGPVQRQMKHAHVAKTGVYSLNSGVVPQSKK